VLACLVAHKIEHFPCKLSWSLVASVGCESFEGARRKGLCVCAVATSFSPLSTALALCAAERVRIFYLLKAGQSVCVFALAHTAIVGGAIGRQAGREGGKSAKATDQKLKCARSKLYTRTHAAER